MAVIRKQMKTTRNVQISASGVHENFRRKAISVTVAMIFTSGVANANPEGGQFAQGLGAISNAGNLTTIQQTTQQAIVNWQSFGSNAGEVIKFVQPNANAAILNRVVGNLPSNLNGLLEGNGRVYLVNPNGIVLGANGVINVNGGFVASTQNVADSAFMQGGALLFTGENTGNIQVLGKINSAQGDIVIIAPKTEIAAGAELKAGQNIQLIAANEVQLSNGKFTVTPKLSNAGQLTVAGTLEAAKVQLEAHNNNLGALAINTTGTIRATGTQTNPDGSVSIMAYGEGSNIKVNGNISAYNNDSSKQGGRIIVGRNEETGELANSADVSGATFTTNKGFVETSGHHLAVDGAQVIAKDWLLDPDNIDITGDSTAATSGYSKIKASDIVTNLNTGTSVTISTTASSRVNQPGYKNTAGTGAGTAVTGDGNILVNADIIKTMGGNTSLTLLADNGITLNKAIKSNSGALDVTLTANGNAVSTANSQGIVMSGSASIDVNGGTVILNGSSKFPTGGFNKGGLYMFGNGGAYASIKGGSVTINASTSGTTSGTAYGMFVDQGTSITATAGDIKVTSKMTGAAAGNAVFTGSNVGPGITWSATGKVDIEGDLTGNANVAATTVYLGSLRINAGGDVNIKATTPNVGAAAIVMQKTNPGWAPGIKAGGDIAILANQGAVALNNFDAADTTNGLGITGRNITIDNTGGSLQNGVYTKGTGYSTSTSWSGVQLNGVASTVAATGNVNIIGNSQSNSNNAGVNISAGIKGATVAIDGRSNAGNGIYSSQAIESTAGDVKITGVSSTSSALSLQGAITASNDVVIKGTNQDASNTAIAAYLTKSVAANNGTVRIEGIGTKGNGVTLLGAVTANGDVTIEGISSEASSASQGVLIQNAVKSNAGDITVTGETNAANQPAVSLYFNGTTSNGSLTTLATGKNININADTLYIDTQNASVNAGTTGSVTIKTTTVGNEIKMGAQDVKSSTASDRVLGLDNGELGRINAGNLVVGAINQGNVTVASSVTTNDITGNVTLLSGSNIAINDVLKVGSNGGKNLTLKAGGSQITQAANKTITANQLHVEGGNAAVTLANADNKVNQLTADVKSLAFKNGQALSVGISGGVASTEAIKATNGASIVTTNGDLTINQAITNTASGDVVLGAGTLKLAGDSSGGDVKTVSGAAVSNGSRNAYVYSGKPSQTGTLAYLDNSFSELYLDSSTPNKAQNADSGVAYGATINGGAKVQVLFREKVSVSLQENLSGATLNKTYGDASTANGSENTALWSDMKVALKASNSTSGVINQLTSTMKDASNNDVKFHVSAATVIDDMTGTLQGAAHSSANYLKADANGYSYNVPTTTGKYTTQFDPNNSAVKVVVGRRALTGSISEGHTTYGSQLVAGQVTFNNKVVNDDVSEAGVTITTTGLTSTSDNLKAGTHQNIQSVSGLQGADKDNYTFADVKGGYVVDKLALTGAAIADVTTTYGTSANTGAVSFGNVQGSGASTDQVSATSRLDGAATSSSGNLKAGRYNQTADSALVGRDADNYTFSGITTTNDNYVVNKLALTATANGTIVAYNGQQQTDTITISGLLANDKVDIVGAGSGTAEGVYQSNLALSGGDAGNYIINPTNAPFTIKVNTPTNYANSNPSANTVLLTPITFGFGVMSGATAAGGEVEGSCDAWSQRAGAGSISVVSLLKPSYMGLRTAKTDTMDAMAGNQATGSAPEANDNPCASTALVNRQASL